MVRTTIQIDEREVQQHIDSLARHGAYGETGVWRTVYSPEWVAAQDEVEVWFRNAGFQVWRDAVGNVWGRVEGTEGGAPVATGSHIDSQTPGGRFDGALGVISGFLAVKALVEQVGRPRRTLEVVSLCEEESSRFAATNFWGSRAIVGLVRPEEPDELTGYDGVRMADAMRAIGLDPDRIPEARRHQLGAWVELHIEQGPLLEEAGVPVAVVNAITGIRHYEIRLTGRSDHAGARPIDDRLDPMHGAAEIIQAVIDTALEFGRPAVTTVGRITHVEPNFPAIVPESVTFTIDARHPDPAQRAKLYECHERTIKEVAARRRLGVEWKVNTDHPPCVSDPDLVETFEQTADYLGIPRLTMASGAAHDTQRMVHIAPVVMLFVQSKDGRSHTPAEFTSTEHAADGVRLLANGLYRLAYDSGSI
jgi:allantoate deiminase